MRKFTHDVESISLTEDEWVAFAHVIQDLCHLHLQHVVSQRLEQVTHPVGTIPCDGTQRRAREMWKTAIASRVKSEGTEENVLA